MINRTKFAYEVIKNANFACDYDSLEKQLQPILDNKVSDNELIDAIKGLFEDLQYKRNMTKERLKLFVYDVNDINYLLFNGQNEKLKEVEVELSVIVDSMNK